jgi:hypothetical protein
LNQLNPCAIGVEEENRRRPVGGVVNPRRIQKSAAEGLESFGILVQVVAHQGEMGESARVYRSRFVFSAVPWGAIVKKLDAGAIALEVHDFEIQIGNPKEPLGMGSRDLEPMNLAEAQASRVKNKGCVEIGDAEADVGEVLDRHGASGEGAESTG